MIVRPYHPDDVRRLELQPAQAWMQPIVADPMYSHCLEHCQAQTGERGGNVLAIGAVMQVWPGRAHLSALLSRLVGPADMLSIHRIVKRIVENCSIRRLEATVDGNFEPGHHWLRMLGFRLETPDGMPGYRPDGGLSYLYARVKP